MIDFKKDPTYAAKPEPVLVDVPSMLFVTYAGHGAPEPVSGATETEFQKAIQVLYGILYSIKFWNKKHPAPVGYDNFTVAPLEALWWTKAGTAFPPKKPADWQWKVLLRLPEFVTPEFFQAIVTELAKKDHTKGYKNAKLEQIREGICVQLMHLGPYDKEGPDIEKLHVFGRETGYELTGKHHELYFGDPRRSKPENLRTILRQPLHQA